MGCVQERLEAGAGPEEPSPMNPDDAQTQLRMPWIRAGVRIETTITLPGQALRYLNRLRETGLYGDTFADVVSALALEAARRVAGEDL